MRWTLVMIAVLVVSPAMFQPVAGVDVQRYPRGTIDPTVELIPTLSGYEFVFQDGADDYPLFGLACTNSPYPYVSTIPLDTQIGFDERMLIANGTTDIPYIQGMQQSSTQDSRIFLTNNDIWTEFREGQRELGETLRFSSDGNYTWPQGDTYNGPNIQWGLPQVANSNMETITVQNPMIRTDYRLLYGGDSFFTNNAIDTWLLVDNGGREMLEADGSEHANKNDFRMLVWDVRGGTTGPQQEYFSRNTDTGRSQIGNYTYYQDAIAYFKLTTDANTRYVGTDVLDSYAYMLQWQPWIGNDRYEQGPDGNLQWYPSFTHVSTGFPGEVLQLTNTLQLIDSFYLDMDGEGYAADDIRKGDMITMMRTANIGTEAAGLVQVIDRISPARVSPVLHGADGTPPTYSDPPQQMFFNVYRLTDPSEEGEVLFRHENVTAEDPGKIVGYHFRPVYDVFGDSVDPRATDVMYIPGYEFSNNVEVTCRPFVWSAGKIASEEVIQYGDAVTVRPNFDCSGTYHLPNIPWVHDSAIVYSDVIPDDYCTVRPDNAPIPFPPTVIPGAVPVYRDILMLVPDYSHDMSNATARVDLKIVPEASPYSFSIEDYTTCGAYDPVNGELGSFMTTDNKTAGLFTDFLGSVIPYSWFVRDNPLVVSCDNLVFHGGEEPSVNVTFSKTLNADNPYYQRFITAIQEDDWGWGVGESEVTDQPGFAPYQNLIFGMPFVAVMGILTSMIGFNRRHIPAAGISYGIILGAMTYFGLIDIPVAAFGAIVTFTIILIFSKGFR